MSHIYPLAVSAHAAFEATTAARTRHEAERLAQGVPVERLETEWLTLSGPDADALHAKAEQAMGQGFVQRYEDVDGTPVLAVSYWKLSGTGAGAPAGPATPDTKAASQESTPEADAPDEDHTDDLYFRSKRTRLRKPRKQASDPRQLDLFSGPDAMGYERRDPDNPGIMLTEEEGDGTTFGG